MKKSSLSVAILFATLVSNGVVNAQTITLKNAPANVQIDGVASEWQGYDENTNDKAKVSYIISSDNNNVYLVLKTKDTQKHKYIYLMKDPGGPNPFIITYSNTLRPLE